MRKLLLLLLACAAPAFAAPFVESDPVDSGTSQCGVFLDANAKLVIPVNVNAAGQKTCKYDLATLATGSHTIAMTVIIPASANNTGGESLKSLPFTFIKQAAPAAPGNLGLTP